METQAVLLRENHLAILEQMKLQQPTVSHIQLSSEAMEIAVQELTESLQAQSENQT